MFSPDSLAAAASLFILGVASVTDIRRRKVPNLLSALGTAVGLLAVVLRPARAMELLIGAIGFGLLFGYSAYKGWVGAGDAKLIFVTALLLGWRLTAYGTIYACVLGAGLTAAWHLARGTTGRLFGPRREPAAIPFAPYLLMGTLAALVSG